MTANPAHASAASGVWPWPRVCVTILGGIRMAAHPRLSKSRRLLGERQESAYEHDAQASVYPDTLACASCLYLRVVLVWGQTFICRSPDSIRVDNHPFIRFHPVLRCTPRVRMWKPVGLTPFNSEDTMPRPKAGSGAGG